VFAIARKKTNGQLARRELSQSVEHFKQAATHAARGTGATVGPKFDAARGRVQPAAYRAKDAASTSWDSALKTLAPLAAGAAADARKTGKDARKTKNKNMKQLQKKTDKALNRKQDGRKAGKLTGFLVTGAAIGAAAAFVLKRRQRQQWDEYDPSRPINSADQAGTGADDTAYEPAAFAQTETTGTAAYATPQTFTSSSTVYGEAADPALPTVDPTVTTGGTTDQTSSTLHSPEVARMAKGTTKN